MAIVLDCVMFCWRFPSEGDVRELPYGCRDGHGGAVHVGRRHVWKGGVPLKDGHGLTRKRGSMLDVVESWWTLCAEFAFNVTHELFSCK